MKNSKDYASKLPKLYRSLKRKHGKSEKVVYVEPVDALVYAILSEMMTLAEAEDAKACFARHFVDLNDLRVSLPDEIVEAIGRDTPAVRETAKRLRQALNAIFNEYNCVSLEEQTKLGKRPIRQALETINGVTSYVVDYCMLTAFDAHAIPVTDKMIEYLKGNDLVDADSDRSDIEGFLSRQVAAKDGYDFYWLLRVESEAAEKAAVEDEQKTSPKEAAKKTAKKTVKKSTSSKATEETPKKAAPAKAKKTAKKAVKKTVKKSAKSTAKKKSAKKSK